MTSTLRLAVELLDRVTNPAYGALANEESALRLADVLRDEEAAARLAREVRLLREPDELTMHGWRWVLSFARARQLRLDPDLLLALSRAWDSASFLATVIEVATTGEEPRGRGREPDVEQQPRHPWVRSLIRDAVTADEPLQPTDRSDPIAGPVYRVTHAQQVLAALMLLDRPAALEGAAALLRQDWPGSDDLLEDFWQRLDLLDSEVADLWLAALAPPPRPDRA